MANVSRDAIKRNKTAVSGRSAHNSNSRAVVNRLNKDRLKDQSPLAKIHLKFMEDKKKSKLRRIQDELSLYDSSIMYEDPA